MNVPGKSVQPPIASPADRPLPQLEIKEGMGKTTAGHNVKNLDTAVFPPNISNIRNDRLSKNPRVSDQPPIALTKKKPQKMIEIQKIKVANLIKKIKNYCNFKSHFSSFIKKHRKEKIPQEQKINPQEKNIPQVSKYKVMTSKDPIVLATPQDSPEGLEALQSHMKGEKLATTESDTLTKRKTSPDEQTVTKGVYHAFDRENFGADFYLNGKLLFKDRDETSRETRRFSVYTSLENSLPVGAFENISRFLFQTITSDLLSKFVTENIGFPSGNAAARYYINYNEGDSHVSITIENDVKLLDPETLEDIIGYASTRRNITIPVEELAVKWWEGNNIKKEDIMRNAKVQDCRSRIRDNIRDCQKEIGSNMLKT